MRSVAFGCCLLAVASLSRADSTFVDTASQPDALMNVDTTIYRPGQILTPYTEVTNPQNLESRMYQNPTKALFKSLLVPGWGQVGNRQYLKAVIAAGLDTWFIASAIHYGRQAADFRRRFEEATDVTNRNALHDLYEDRKDERQKFTWFAIIITFVSMFDAYVDAHLSGFPRRPASHEIGLEIGPLSDGMMAATATVSF